MGIFQCLIINCSSDLLGLCVLFLTVYFEISINAKEVAKTLERPCVPFAQAPAKDLLGKARQR